ncbi:uncharacterized protein LOC144167899 [Haemaphysalis longicornis]
MNRWQCYLEDTELYHNSIIGFREKLSTQDAMLLLKHEIIDDVMNTRDNKTVMGLDHQSAFDKVRYSAILVQVSKLNMGKRTYAYICDFLTGRYRQIWAGDLQLPVKQLDILGSPQGSVISLLLLNLIMIGVADRCEHVEGVLHTIYADDVTLWVTGGSDGHIEDTLQEAVNVIEDQLDGTGLICSPSKSESLIIPPKCRRKKQSTTTITVCTAGGQVTPKVNKIYVLGLLLERNRVNGATVNKLATKAAAAVHLIRRISARKAGMKKGSHTHLVQSFAISHIAYVTAFHNWQQCEWVKVDAIIRKT